MREKEKAFFRRSMEFFQSEFIETRTKVHRLDEGYTHILKMRDFTEDPKERFREIKYFGLGRLPTRATTLQEVWILSTWFISNLKTVLR